MRGPICLLLLLSLAVALRAAGQDLERPGGWRVRTDDRAADPESDLWFVSMPPGWDVTAGPAAILWDPASEASGVFRLEAEAYRFPGESADGWGMFLGGEDLDTDAPRYLAFLVDRQGRYRIYHRAGEDVHEVEPWTKHEAIVARSADPEADNAKNVIAAEVGPDSLRFEVNGRTVAAYERLPYMETDGLVGLRVHEGVDVHVTRLDVVPLEETSR